MSPLGVRVALAVLVVAGPLVGPAEAQQGVEVGTPARKEPREAPELGIEPTQPDGQTGAREQESYPDQVRSVHDPAFVRPFASTRPVSSSRAARFGLSGWTAPALPFDIREASGGAAFGLTILWDVPVSQQKPPQAAPPGQR